MPRPFTVWPSPAGKTIPILGPPIYNEPIADGNSIYLDSFGTGWRNYDPHQWDISNSALEFVVTNGGLSSDSLVLFQNSGKGISSSLAKTDPEGAAAWVASLPSRAHREITNISLGAGTTDPAVLNAALQLAMERWLALSGGENTERIEFLAAERGRGRGGENSDRDIALAWINSGYYAESILPDYSSVVSVPEPSAALLGALGALGLLRRRRED